MSGNNAEQTTLKEKILTDKKNKKINQAKMILALILSNFFIYILVSPSNKVVESKLENKVPSGYSRIVIKAESLVTSEQNAKTISILNKEKATGFFLPTRKMLSTLKKTPFSLCVAQRKIINALKLNFKQPCLTQEEGRLTDTVVRNIVTGKQIGRAHV